MMTETEHFFLTALNSDDYDTVSEAYSRCMKYATDLRFRKSRRDVARRYLPKMTAHMRDVAEAKLATL